MAKANTETYIKVLLTFKQLARKHGVELVPKVISCDYEKAQMEALDSVFQKVTLQGCSAHHKRALNRNWKKIMKEIEVENRLGFKRGDMVFSKSHKDDG
jgi:transposase-like protein